MSITKLLIMFVLVGLAYSTMGAYGLFGLGKGSESITQFVPAHSIDQTSIVLAQSAMLLLGQSVSTSTIQTQNLNTTAQDLNPKTLISYDIITALQSSTDKNKTIAKHISDLDKAMSSLQAQTTIYQTQATQAQAKLAECSNDKKIADGAVISAINEGNFTNLDNLIQSSVTAGQCEAQYRIISNAATLVVKKQTTMIALLKKKSSFIEQNKATILRYPEVIANPEIIQELIKISQFQNY